MSGLFTRSWVLVGASILSCVLQASDDSYPTTVWNTPDFSGNWDYGSLTPLERPEQFKDKAYFTEAEAEAFVADFGSYIEDRFRGLEGDSFVGLDTWLDFGSDVEPDLRTSRVVVERTLPSRSGTHPPGAG